jgi:hypothetical protein
MNITDAMLVEKYLELKASVASRSETFDAEIKPFKDGMATIENEFLRRLDERGADNTKTEHGTAYKSTLMNVKVVDRDALLKYATTYWEQGGGDMLIVSAQKDAVKAYIEANKVEPPGVETSQYVRVNIRRT